MVRRLPAVLLVGGVLACASPTLPLPPPTGTMQEMVDSTHVSLAAECGGVEGGSQVSVVNLTRTAPGTDVDGYNVLASPCGSWSGPLLYALPNDSLIITYATGTDTSLPEALTVGKP